MRCLLLARRRRSKNRRIRRRIARPATPPTTPPTTAGVDPDPPLPEPAPAPAVDEGDELVPLAPPEPPTPPPTTAPVADGVDDDGEMLEDGDCDCEAVALPELDRAAELVVENDEPEVVRKAPLVCEDLDLVDVIKVLFTPVVNTAGLKVLVETAAVLDTAGVDQSAGESQLLEEYDLPVMVELPLFAGKGCPLADWDATED